MALSRLKISLNEKLFLGLNIFSQVCFGNKQCVNRKKEFLIKICVLYSQREHGEELTDARWYQTIKKDVYHSLGVKYFRVGDYKKALKYEDMIEVLPLKRGMNEKKLKDYIQW